MSERQKYTLVINGAKYPISTEESEEYIRKIEFYLNSRIQNSKDKTGMHFSDSITLALLSIELADTLFKTQKQFDQLKGETDKLIEKYDELANQNENSYAEIEALQAEISSLKEKIFKLELGSN